MIMLCSFQGLLFIFKNWYNSHTPYDKLSIKKFRAFIARVLICDNIIEIIQRYELSLLICLNVLNKIMLDY